MEIKQRLFTCFRPSLARLPFNVHSFTHFIDISGGLQIRTDNFSSLFEPKLAKT